MKGESVIGVVATCRLVLQLVRYCIRVSAVRSGLWDSEVARQSVWFLSRYAWGGRFGGARVYGSLVRCGSEGFWWVLCVGAE